MDNVFFSWTGKVEKDDWFHLCLLSLQSVSDCNIFVSSPELQRGSEELLNSMGVEVLWFEKKLWDNRRMTCKIERANDLLQSLPEGDNLMVFDGDMLFLSDPFEAFENEFDYCYTTRNQKAWAATNGGCWGARSNKEGKEFMSIFVEQLNNPTWEPYVNFRMNHPHKRGLEERDWWVDQDFSCVIHQWREHINNGSLGVDVKVLDISPKYNFNVSGLSKEEISEEIKSKRNSVLHFKSGAFDRWADGVNTSNDRLVKLIGESL